MPKPSGLSRRAPAFGPKASHPRLRGACFQLERIYMGGLFQGQADIVEPLDQAALAVRVDLEGDLAAVGAEIS